MDDLGEFLFASADLGAGLDEERQRVSVSVRGWNADELLSLPEQDIVDELIEKHRVECPMLVREHGELDPVGRAAVPGQDFLGRPTQREQTKLVLVVPFVGDKEVFRCRARTFSHNPPRADIRDSQIRLVWQGDNGDVTSVRAYFEASLDKIEGAPR